jgi:hypothetical protein
MRQVDVTPHITEGITPSVDDFPMPTICPEVSFRY